MKSENKFCTSISFEKREAYRKDGRYGEEALSSKVLIIGTSRCQKERNK